MSRHVTYCLVLLGSLAANAQPLPVPGPKLQAPPPAPPIQQLPAPTGPSGPQPKPLGITPYSIAQPTDEEQLYLEYLNRMRANPTAEGQRLATTTDPSVLSAYGQFMVDLNLMQAEFATNPPVPPLAMNAQLLSAARWHSGDMFTNQYQGHYQTNGSIVMSPGDRIATNGYRASIDGENVFSYATSVFQGHTAFAVDWGPPPAIGGMQNPPGHRDNMLYPSFREVGVGVVDGVNGSVGPQLATQDFGTQISSSPFLTGVVYFDLNGNGFYDVGEGIGGVTVNTPGSTYFAVTADSGGYAIPISTNGHYTVTFTASRLSNQTTVTISNLQNAKIDYSPTYSPPTITGPNPASLNQSNTYGFTPVPAATGYQLLQAELSAYTLVEGAENGLSNVTVVSTPGYSVISSDFAQSGNYSFNLEHFSGTDQTITLNPILLVSANSQLSFAEFLDYAFSNEVAEAQISIDSGSSWQTVWSKPGNDGSGPVDSAFVNQTISLGAYAGKVLQVRFVYAYSGGLYFSGGSGVGLYLDNIAVSNAEELNGFITNNIASGNTFNFSPAVATNYLLEVRAQINSRTLPWGPPFQVSVTASAASPTIQLVAPILSGNQVRIDFAVPNYRAGMAFQLLKSTDLQNGWTLDTSATLQTVVTNSSFRFTTSFGAAQRLFFKVKGT
jgi:uncharacterized protein YkwD